jgi:hypothetical protein
VPLCQPSGSACECGEPLRQSEKYRAFALLLFAELATDTSSWPGLKQTSIRCHTLMARELNLNIGMMWQAVPEALSSLVCDFARCVPRRGQMVTQPSPYKSVLLTAARGALSQSDRGPLRSELGCATELTPLIEQALRHGTCELLCQNLIAQCSDLIAPDVLSGMRIFLDGRRDANQAAVVELINVLKALKEAHVDALPFKGPTFAYSVYRDPSSRSFRDLDFLIRSEQIGATIRTLRELGYRSDADHLRPIHRVAYYRYNGQDLMYAQGRTPLEPHWAFAPMTFSVRVDMEGMWRRSTKLTLNGESVPKLSVEDTLLVAVMHGTKERWHRLIWIVDVAEFVRNTPRVDWDAVLSLARGAGLYRALLVGLTLSQELLGAPIPQDICKLIRKDKKCSVLTNKLIRDLFQVPDSPISVFDLSYFSWSVRECLSDRLRYATRTIVTPRREHFMLLHIPQRLHFLYPLVKILHDVILPVWVQWKMTTIRKRRAKVQAWI